MFVNIRPLIRFEFLTVLLFIATRKLSTIYGALAFARSSVTTSSQAIGTCCLLLFGHYVRRFEGFNMGKVFEHWGWRVQGFFDPTRSLSVGECSHDTAISA
ncbi:hypothetical protein PHMEG_00012779 [Phytophthora megakarya]|uniref:Uncharacterized protein n=1 Tax=Phytophthora megakarya TaxID=4795 RepID=A0A225WAH5_9STRA|nr:hypothetical protein PHMEG_00012779 [Phytophthora megakarya]